jgi:hypothetical protein
MSDQPNTRGPRSLFDESDVFSQTLGGILDFKTNWSIFKVESLGCDVVIPVDPDRFHQSLRVVGGETLHRLAAPDVHVAVAVVCDEPHQGTLERKEDRPPNRIYSDVGRPHVEPVEGVVDRPFDAPLIPSPPT